MDPDDEFGPFVMEELGADKVLWGLRLTRTQTVPPSRSKTCERCFKGLRRGSGGWCRGRMRFRLYGLE